MRHPWKSDLSGKLSWFLVVYLTMLLGILLAVHMLQPAWGGPGSASRTPPRQERPKAAKQTAVLQPGAVPASSAPPAA